MAAWVERLGIGVQTTPADRERVPAGRRRRRNRNTGSSLIFGALAVVLAAIAFFYYQDDDAPPATAPVPEVAGHNELINVKRALEAQGLTVEFGRTAVRATGLTPPPQPLTVGDATVYVFIYEGVEDREAESANLDPASITLTTPTGEPLDAAGAGGGELHVAAGSNVIALVADGSPELIEQVDAAIASLP